MLAKQGLFLRFAERWADWWSKNWKTYVKNETEAQLDQTKRVLDQIRKAKSLQSRPTTYNVSPPDTKNPNIRLAATVEAEPGQMDVRIVLDPKLAQGKK